jgi:hypothetical protein
MHILHIYTFQIHIAINKDYYKNKQNNKKYTKSISYIINMVTNIKMKLIQ